MAKRALFSTRTREHENQESHVVRIPLTAPIDEIDATGFGLVRPSAMENDTCDLHTGLTRDAGMPRFVQRGDPPKIRRHAVRDADGQEVCVC